MKKIGWGLCFLSVVCVLMLQPSVFAEEADVYDSQAELFGVSELTEALPKESRKMLEAWGVNGAESNALMQFNAAALLESLAEQAQENALPAIRNFAWSMGILLICAMLRGMNGGESGDIVRLFRVLMIVLLAEALLSPLQTLLKDTETVIGAASGFSAVFVPIYAGIAAANGQPLTAGAYAAWTVGAAEGIQILMRIGLMPLLRMLFAVTTVLAATGQALLAQIAQGIRTCFRWILGLSMSLFAALLALQSTVRAAADSVSGRAVKFAVGGSVPIVGGVLNEALNTARSCLHLLKSTVGVFGILAGCAIFVPILLRVVLWTLSLQLSAFVGAVLEEQEAANFLRAMASLLSLLSALLLCCVLFLVISTGILLATKAA